MNANKQDAGGLPELPEPVGHVHSDYEYCAERPFKNDAWPVSVYEVHQVRAYGELCRAAPAGGDVEVVRLRQLLAASQEQVRILSDMVERGQAHHERMMKLMDSAPAGSGEVEEMAKRLLVEASDVVENTCLHDVLMRAAALLRKLQQGADYTRVGWLSVGPSRDVSFGVNNRSVEDRPGTYDLYIASQGQEGGHARD